MFRKITAAIAIASCAVANADVAVVEGFENTNDPAGWQLNLTPTHTSNVALNGTAVPEYVNTFVTEGALAGLFHAYWSSTPVAAASNPYETTGPLLFWAARFNVSSPAALPNNSFDPADTILEADVANESESPVRIALAVDRLGDANIQRGPLVTIDAESTGTYSWNMATVPAVPFTGNPTQNTNARLKSLLVYTDVQPTSDSLDLIVDNIRTVTEIDVTPPAVPRPLAFEQGAAPGQAVLRWQPVADADLSHYNVYITTDAQFGTPTANRMVVSADAATSVAAGVHSVTLSGLQPNEIIYAAVTAVDNAPQSNESEKSMLLAVKLLANGSQPLDRIVLDLNEFQPGQPGFLSNSYMPAVAYTAEALDGLGRSFDTVTATALGTAQADLTISANGVVIWSNMLDGASISGNSISATNLARIQSFYQGGGNIIISGTHTASDVQAAYGNLATTLKASLVSNNVMLSQVNFIGPLSGLPSITTNLSSSQHTVAYSTLANDAIQVTGGSIRLALYDGIDAQAGAAGIGYEGALVLLGFAFESVGSPASPANSPAIRQQLLDDMIFYLIGETSAYDWQLFQ